MTIGQHIDDKHMNNLVERFYDNIDENDISQCEVFEEFLDNKFIKDKFIGNIWSDDDLQCI